MIVGPGPGGDEDAPLQGRAQFAQRETGRRLGAELRNERDAEARFSQRSGHREVAGFGERSRWPVSWWRRAQRTRNATERELPAVVSVSV